MYIHAEIFILTLHPRYLLPHVLDFGMILDDLFSNIPFIACQRPHVPRRNSSIGNVKRFRLVSPCPRDI